VTDDDLEDVRARYASRADRFEALVAGAAPETWDDPSPCDDWLARDVVQHALDMHVTMLRPLDREPTPAPSVAEDPLAAFRAARADVEALLDDEGLARGEVQTPMGPMRLADHVDQVASADLVLHGWDLARATGQDDTMDPREVEAMWPGVQQLDERMRTPEAFGPGIVVFGPLVDVPEDAPLQDRLLGLVGRDPAWVAPAPG
jgi:uncharacterized protein (TIGR03086 family)